MMPGASFPGGGGSQLPVYPSDATKYLDGSGHWTVPAGPGAVNPSVTNNFIAFSNTVGATKDAGVGLAALPILAPAASGRNVIQPTGAAIIPFTIKGFAAQSAHLLEIQNSAAAVLVSVDPDANFAIAGASDAASTRYWSETKTYTANTVSLSGGIRRAVWEYNPAGAITATQIVGATFIVDKQGTQSGAGANVFSIGLEGWSTTNANATSGTYNKLVGVSAIAQNQATGTVAQQIALLASMAASSGAVITNAYGLVIATSAAPLGRVALNAGATITNTYGIYVEAISVGTNKYALYTNAGQVRIGDTMKVIGHTMFGNNAAAVDANFVIAVSENQDPTSADKAAIVGTTTFDNNYATGAVEGILGEATFNGPGKTANFLLGAAGSAYFNGGVSAVMMTGLFGQAYVNATSATITQAIGLKTQIFAVGTTNTIIDARGINILQASVTGGSTITTLYGLKVETVTQGGTNYAIYTDLGLVHFGDNVEHASGKSITLNAGNVITDTTTGTKIGTATAQKFSLWNKVPIVQPTTGIAAAAFVANTSGTLNDSATFGGYTLGQIAAALINFGLLA